MGQMTMRNVKGVASSDEPTENYLLTQQFPSAIQSLFQLIALPKTGNSFPAAGSCFQPKNPE